ncbi:MAG: glycine--tRNA ligase subunit beta [Candidatus Cloacimonas sp.]|nr:glycine--tRNA ligase subunit beta [Candidatus Cloacimonadota bacterium]
MDKKDFLFEIGVEELPASYIAPAVLALSGYFDESLRSKNLSFTRVDQYSTPRRLTIIVKDLDVKQRDEIVERIGPAKRVAYNEDGTLSKAGAGFIRGAQCEEADSFIVNTSKGEYIAVKKMMLGEQTIHLLEEIATAALKKISFPKTMYWRAKTEKFARPIRWLVAIYGEELVKVEYNGIKTDKITNGNVLSKTGKAIVIDTPNSYLSKLEIDGLVIADREKRKRSIEDQIIKLSTENNSRLLNYKELLEEVTDIVEYPTAVLASFKEDYLTLPNRLIEATLVKNQKYFPLYNEDGGMNSHFIFIANNRPDYAENTKEGNERVVKARLDDAEFYYKEDSAKNIEYFNEKLNDIIFAAKLGTVYEKTRRIMKLAAYISRELGLSEETALDAQRLADVCKFDLTSLMVGEKEFATLQGYVGRNYATVWGEKESVAIGIEEHYFPLNSTHSLPSNECATVVSIADKIDTLCGVFGTGVIPTGSNDPFALRRVANGIVRILFEKELSFNLKELIEYAYELFEEKLEKDNQGKENLLNFFDQRIEWYLQQQGVDQGVCRAVMAESDYEFTAIQSKAILLNDIRDTEEFKLMTISFKRVSNIISKESEFQSVDDSLFIAKEEKELFDALVSKEKIVQELVADREYAKVIDNFMEIRIEIDAFFDGVMVNVEDKRVRDNRYALLKRIREMFLTIGDLSLIVFDNEK